jgi:hypothetical protein
MTNSYSRNMLLSNDLLTLCSNAFFLKGPAADATDAPQPQRLIVQPCDEDNVFFRYSE